MKNKHLGDIRSIEAIHAHITHKHTHYTWIQHKQVMLLFWVAGSFSSSLIMASDKIINVL